MHTNIIFNQWLNSNRESLDFLLDYEIPIKVLQGNIIILYYIFIQTLHQYNYTKTTNDF